MRWESALNYLNTDDINTIRWISRKHGITLQNKTIDNVFSMLYDTKEIDRYEIEDIRKRYNEATSKVKLFTSL